MEDKDIRWKQRFSNYSKALSQLELFVNKGEELNEMEEQGLIKSFEYTFELSWNTIKDFYESQGEIGIQGSKDAFRLAYQRELINDGEQWMSMIESRIKTAHTYDEEKADEVAHAIRYTYYNLFKTFRQTMQKIISGEDNLFESK